MAKQAAGIYFILAPAHHGAAQLSLILNNHADILSLGDSNPLNREDQICSCGSVVSECPFWIGIAEATYANQDDPIPNMLPQVPYITGNTGLNNTINGVLSFLAYHISPKLWRAVYEPAERFLGIYERFFTACSEWVPYKVFVDGERSALKFMALASMGFPVKGIIHLVRDPRAYAAAAKQSHPDVTAEQAGMEWVAGHNKIRKMGRFFPKIPVYTLRYEDMVENPDELAKKIFNYMGLRDDALPHAQADTRKHHLIGLNAVPDFDGSIAASEKWQDSLHLDDQSRLINAAEPLFSEFGYKS